MEFCDELGLSLPFVSLENEDIKTIHGKLRKASFGLMFKSWSDYKRESTDLIDDLVVTYQYLASLQDKLKRYRF